MSGVEVQFGAGLCVFSSEWVTGNPELKSGLERGFNVYHSTAQPLNPTLFEDLGDTVWSQLGFHYAAQRTGRFRYEEIAFPLWPFVAISLLLAIRQLLWIRRLGSVASGSGRIVGFALDTQTAIDAPVSSAIYPTTGSDEQ